MAKSATPVKTRNELLSKKIIKSMEKRGFEGFYCETSEDAIKKVLELIPENSSVSWGGSSTIRDMGLAKALNEGNYESHDRDLLLGEPDKAHELYRKVFNMDFFISSANAISEDGVIVNIDGLGNRVAAITFGPKKVIFVIGMNKVVRDEEAAIQRTRTHAAPINTMRFDINSPCHVTGSCGNCTVEGCICAKLLLLRTDIDRDRIKVILINEILGF